MIIISGILIAIGIVLLYKGISYSFLFFIFGFAWLIIMSFVHHSMRKNLKKNFNELKRERELNNNLKEKIEDLNNSKQTIDAENSEVQRLKIEKNNLTNEVNKLHNQIALLKLQTEQKELDDYKKARLRIINNYNKKKIERQALIDLIEEGVIFKEEDEDLKYLRQLRRKYKLDL